MSPAKARDASHMRRIAAAVKVLDDAGAELLAAVKAAAPPATPGP